MNKQVVRVRYANEIRFGYRTETSVRILSSPPWCGDAEVVSELGFADLQFLSPVMPSKIVCVGLNYALHVKESATRSTSPDEPLIFLKPTSAILDPGKEILLPENCGRVDHEAEVALVVGERLHRVSENEAIQGIYGVTALNDVTAREYQESDGQWTRAKGFDTFCPIGPVISTGLNPDNLRVQARVNGETRQSGSTRDFLFSTARLVSFISSIMTLYPGDVISTGTPEGVSPLHPGDIVEIEVEGVGTLTNPVQLSPAHSD